MTAALLCILICAAPSESDVCKADFVAHGSDPYIRYLSLASVPKKVQGTWAATLQFAIPSASREELLDHQIPQQVPGTNAFRIDLQRLGWDVHDWLKVLEKYPYATKYNPLIVNGAWLVSELGDPRDSDALYRLLYGGKKIPKTDAEFIAFWGVDLKQQAGQQFGWVETRSQVAKQGSRFVERFNARGMSLWRTKDVNHITADTDPLEHLDGKFKFDGSELIAQIPKVSVYKRSRGALQTYLLANGQGKVVQEAPVRLVQDYTNTLGQTAIVATSSCVSCHTAGMQPPTENGVEESLKSGITLYAYSKGKQEEIEAFHLTTAATQLTRDNENYQAAVLACNGLTGPENAEAYRDCLNQYRADLSLEDCARELYTTPSELRLALGYAAANKIELGARVAGLAHGRKIARDDWEGRYLACQQMLVKWISIQ